MEGFKPPELSQDPPVPEPEKTPDVAEQTEKPAAEVQDPVGLEAGVADTQDSLESDSESLESRRITDEMKVGTDRRRAQIELSNLYIATGEWQAAEECLTGVMNEADQVRDEDSYYEAQEKLKELDSLRPKVEEKIESLKLTKEERGKIAGNKESILDLRGVHIGDKLARYLKKITVTDKSDLEKIADQVEALVEEERWLRQSPEEFEEDLRFRIEMVNKRFSRLGFEHPSSIELVEEWKVQSLRWVKKVGTPRAQITHDMRIYGFHLRFGDKKVATEMARDVYRRAVEDKQDDIIKQILEDFPEFEN